MRPYLIIGNPESNRVGLFQEALAERGHAPARVVRWFDVAEHPEVLGSLPDNDAIVRIDSAGRDFDVERAFLRLGYDDVAGTDAESIPPDRLDRLRFERGRILAPRQNYRGFLRALDRLAALFARRPGWQVQNRPAAIAELFDKRRTARRFRASGIPVPRVLPVEPQPESLRAAMEASREDTVYVKLAFSSSAAGLGVYTFKPGHESLMTTVELTDDGLYNTRRVRRETQRGRVDRVLGFLLREGAHVEARVRKARLAGAFFDLRVVVVAGEPAFVVVRQNRHPITNIHLGGWRGDLDLLREAMDPAAFDSALLDCRRAAEIYGCFQTGVDVVIEPGFHSHRILEANAFGDLFPGLGIYGWEVDAAARAA